MQSGSMGLLHFGFNQNRSCCAGITKKRKMIDFGLFITAALLQILVAQAVEVQHVQLGDTVSMGCNLTYAYGTAWLKNNPHGLPALVVSASLRKGDTIYEHRPDPRFSVEVVNRSLSLTIADIEESDLGMYFCTADSNTVLLIGSGTVLKGPFRFGFYHLYCTAVGGGLLSMVICVCVTHCKTKVHRKTTLNEEQV